MIFYWRIFGTLLLALNLLAGVSSTPAGNSRQESQQQVREEGDGMVPQESSPIQKRSLEEGSKEEMNILKDLILSHVVSEIENLRERQQEEDLKQQEDDQKPSSGKSSAKDKRLFLSLTGRREDVPAIKRQIRYHQCYFNPISCFRRK